MSTNEDFFEVGVGKTLQAPPIFAVLGGRQSLSTAIPLDAMLAAIKEKETQVRKQTHHRENSPGLAQTLVLFPSTFTFSTQLGNAKLGDVTGDCTLFGPLPNTNIVRLNNLRIGFRTG
ncbi:uncharacterized protein LOC130936084 [Arachis stenosperma]|uniref:uncharacterized protein LOC130936084 n=1 Tax=Arachis stenosperma TaxID=217475 RepID=UPI0025AC0EEB|nr:uncharacterized protein LOC130936084 [Arachis stenosperma]